MDVLIPDQGGTKPGSLPGRPAVSDEARIADDPSEASGRPPGAQEDITRGSVEPSAPFTAITRQRLDALTQESLGGLSSVARQLSDIPELQRQRDVFNSAMVYTKPWSHLVVSRFAHQVHAAAQVNRLKQVRDDNPGQLDLNDYELKVLESVLLLHDFGHVVGSHSMDKAFASMPGAPTLRRFGLNPLDYHELHGAQELGKGACSESVRSILGSPLFDDVLAVLTFGARSLPDAERRELFGSYQPTLSQARLGVLHNLEDMLDRNSFVPLDYLAAGYPEDLVDEAKRVADDFLRSVKVAGDVVSVICDPSRDPYRRLIELRRYHFDNIAVSPADDLICAVMQAGISEVFQRSEKSRATSHLYSWARDRALGGQHEEVLGELWRELSSPDLCVTDRFAPMVTLTKQHLSPSGLGALEVLSQREEVLPGSSPYPAGLVSAVAGRGRYDMSFLELGICEYVKSQGLSGIPIYVLSAPSLDREFEYGVYTEAGAEKRTIQHQSCPRGYVAIVAEAIDRNGQTRDLSKLQEVVETFLYKRGYLREGVIPRAEYKPRILLEPRYKGVLRPEVEGRMLGAQPLWARMRGGCGLIKQSTH
jgi:hypothetical protein